MDEYNNFINWISENENLDDDTKEQINKLKEKYEYEKERKKRIPDDIVNWIKDSVANNKLEYDYNDLDEELINELKKEKILISDTTSSKLKINYSNAKRYILNYQGNLLRYDMFDFIDEIDLLIYNTVKDRIIKSGDKNLLSVKNSIIEEFNLRPMEIDRIIKKLKQENLIFEEKENDIDVSGFILQGNESNDKQNIEEPKKEDKPVEPIFNPFEDFNISRLQSDKSNDKQDIEEPKKEDKPAEPIFNPFEDFNISESQSNESSEEQDIEEQKKEEKPVEPIFNPFEDFNISESQSNESSEEQYVVEGVPEKEEKPVEPIFNSFEDFDISESQSNESSEEYDIEDFDVLNSYLDVSNSYYDLNLSSNLENDHEKDEIKSLIEYINDYKKEKKPNNFFNLKVLNKKKFTFGGIPMKLYKNVLNVRAKFLNSLLAKIVKSKSKSMIERIKDLTDKEVECLFNGISREEYGDNYLNTLPDIAWREILQKYFDKNYNDLIQDFKRVDESYDYLLILYDELKKIDFQLKSKYININKKEELIKIYMMNVKKIGMTLKDMNLIQERIGEKLEPNINSKSLKYVWDNIVKSKFSTYGKNREMLEDFNIVIDEEIDGATDSKNILEKIELMIYREKLNKDYFIESKDKLSNYNKRYDMETSRYINLHDEYYDRYQEWEESSPLHKLIHRKEKPNELNMAIEKIEDGKYYF